MFPVFFEMLLGPFVSTMCTLVRVLESFNVNDYWSAFINIDSYSRAIP